LCTLLYEAITNATVRPGASWSETNVRLGNDLKRCRFDKGDMSQEALARAIGVTRQTIIAIEKGRFGPSTLLALKLARFFGKPVEQIFHLDESDPDQGHQ
jgi:putative transcriptional regulator